MYDYWRTSFGHSPTPPPHKGGVHGWFAGAASEHASLSERVDPRALLTRGTRRGDPFVLLDDQLSGTAALFQDPVRIICAHHPEDIRPALAKASAIVAEGGLLTGFLSYSAGSAFDALATCERPLRPGADPPLLWLAQFAKRDDYRLASPANAGSGIPIEPALGRSDYEAAVQAALDHIRRGDIYQVNLTFPAVLDASSPVDLYCNMRVRARAPFGAYLDIGDRQILSFSPELFFRIDEGRVLARPMKGTRARDADPLIDAQLEAQLAGSEKDRAENLMIVDLIRNDLSRVCRAGSVSVPRLFDIEAYPTVWQMTSTVMGDLRADLGVLDVLGALFPCGSITGAPKIMASRIIAGLEHYARGIYTGTIGCFGAREGAFNVAIRTIDVLDGMGRLDVGAGIVADSDPQAEWEECLAKARFLTAGP